METLGAYDAKTRLSELLDRTFNGETFEITKNGRLVGRLVPPEKARDRAASRAAINRLKAMRGKFGTMTAEELKATVHEGHKY